MGGEERMAGFPPLVGEDITLKEGLGESKAVADIKFSSADCTQGKEASWFYRPHFS